MMMAKISIYVAMPSTKVQVIADSLNSVGSFTKHTVNLPLCILTTLFKLPKLVMRIFLSQFDLNTIKRRRLGLRSSHTVV